MSNRYLSTIAEEIIVDMSGKTGQEAAAYINSRYGAAKPYLYAMRGLSRMNDFYGLDAASGIVSYFLANASTWRGETARRIKAELNAMLDSHRKAR